MGRGGKGLGLTQHPGLQGHPGEGSLHPPGRWEEVRTDTWPLPGATRSILLPLCILHVHCTLNRESLEPLKNRTGKPRQHLSLKSSQKSIFAGVSFCWDLSPTGQEA